ncbi:hypothetical protein BMT54_10005 [Pasteurellaceae bacterium 15-036681]|nr:hypothetical protein BMT54_10005 [Pasteurellaceae bacterium 15-036681]
MAGNLTLLMRLQAQDYASRVIDRLSQNVRRANQDTERTTRSSNQTQRREIEQTARVTEQAARTNTNSARRTAQVRQSLGVRSEREIQREIQRTIAQYNRLARSGTATSRELARASDAARNRIRELNAEMGKTTTGQRLGNFGRGAMSLAGGAVVGYQLAKQPIKTAADYNLQLAYLANTAYSDKDLAGRKAGMETIHNSIKEAVTKYGGSKETAMEALGELVSKGRVSVDDALSLLPSIQMNAVATGASTLDIASLVNAGLGYGIERNQIQDFIDYANAAGKAGGFELKDMAQYAPMLFSAASGAGITGMDGAKQMFKMLQQIYNVSGGSSETATNTMNFLSKLNSQDTLNRAKKIEYYDKKGKLREVDLKASMAGYMRQGKNTVDSFLAVVDDILAGDKGYQEALKRLNSAQNEGEKREALERIADYMMGSRVAELVADRQAWLGLHGIRSQVETGENVEKGYETAVGGTEKDGEFIASQAAIKYQKAENTAEMGKIEAFSSTAELTGDLAQKMADYGAQYPELTTALMGATEGIKILGGAAMAAAGAMAIFGGGKGIGDLFGRMPKGTVAGRTVDGGMRAGGGRLGSALKFAGYGLGAYSILSTAQAIGEEQPYQQARDEMKREEQAGARLAFAKGYTANHAKTTEFKYGGQAIKTTGTPLYGGYALAHLQQDNDVAKARYEMGGYSEAQYQARVNKNNALRQSYSAQPNSDVGSIAKEAARLAVYMGDLTTQQGTMNGQFDSITTNFSQYHSEIQALSQAIPAAIQASLDAHQKVIQIHNTVDLDGRVIAQNSSEHIFREFARG